MMRSVRELDSNWIYRYTVISAKWLRLLAAIGFMPRAAIVEELVPLHDV